MPASQIDVIQFLDNINTIVKAFASPFKIKAGTNVTFSASGSVLTVNATGGGGSSDHAALSHLAYADAGHTGFTPSTRKVDTTAPLAGGGDLSADRTLSIPKATASVDGYLDNDDWTIFNNKLSSIAGLNHAVLANLGYAAAGHIGFQEQLESGFVNKNTDSTIFFDTTGSVGYHATPRTFYIYGTYTFHVQGVNVSKVTLIGTADYIQISNVTGMHWIYFDNAGVLHETTTLPPNYELLYRTGCLVSAIYWNAADAVAIYFSDERHGKDIGYEMHKYEHVFEHTRFLSGFALAPASVDGTGDNDADAEISFANGSLADEDLTFVVTDGSPQDIAPIGKIPILYRDGITNWRLKQPNNFPLIYSDGVVFTGANSRPPYNQNVGGTWQLTQIGSSNYVLVHYFATNDMRTPIMGIQGQAVYTSITAARTGADQELANLVLNGLPVEEFKFIGTVIYQSITPGYLNTPHARIRSTDAGTSYIDWRTSAPSPIFIATDHSSLANLAYATSGHTGFTPAARLINTTAPITGGGDLSADRTLAMPAATNAVDGYLTAADHTLFSGIGSMPYSSTFDASASWGAASGGLYSIAVTHNLGTTNIIPAFYDTTGEQVFPSVVVKTSDNILTFSVSELPNNRFAGRVVILTGAAAVATREILTADRTYYVRADGNDANTGLVNSAGGAFLTPQKAANVICALDIAGKTITVQLGDGTYTSGIKFAGLLGGAGSNIIVQGNAGTPANVVISTTSLDAFLAMGNMAIPIVAQNFKVQTATSGTGLKAQSNGNISFANIVFGACASAHVHSNQFSFIQATGNYSVTGASVYHWLAQGYSNLAVFSKTITISGTPAFSGAWLLGTGLSFFDVYSNTFSGSATGTRYNAFGGCLINTNGGGANYLPGNGAGAVYTGAQYF